MATDAALRKFPPVPPAELLAAKRAIPPLLRNEVPNSDGEIEIAVSKLTSLLDLGGHSCAAQGNALTSLISSGMLTVLDGEETFLGDEYLEYREVVTRPAEGLRTTAKFWKWAAGDAADSVVALANSKPVSNRGNKVPPGAPSKEDRDLTWAKECRLKISNGEFADQSEYIDWRLIEQCKIAKAEGKKQPVRRTIELAVARGFKILKTEKKKK